MNGILGVFRRRAAEPRQPAQTAPSSAPLAVTQDQIARVRAIDPLFERSAFLAGASSLFRDVRAALSEGNVDGVTGLLAPPLAAPIARRLAYETSTLRRRTMSAIDDVTPLLTGLDVSNDGELRAVVRFDVAGRLGQIALDAETPAATQLAALATRRWFEIWHLSRPSGATTPPLPAACESCGAPASGESHCRFCGALLIDAAQRCRVDAIECLG